MGVILIEHHVRTKCQLVKNRSFTLVQQRVRLFFTTLSNPLPDGSSISKIENIYFKWKSLYVLRSLLSFKYVEKHETLSPWEDHQFRVNLWNLRLWRHALYISKHGKISFLYLRHEQLTIYNISFMHKVYESLLQVFIEPIGFTLDKILNFIFHCLYII